MGRGVSNVRTGVNNEVVIGVDLLLGGYTNFVGAKVP